MPLGFCAANQVAAEMGRLGRGGCSRQGDFRWGECVGLVDEVAEGALQGHGFGGEGADGLGGASGFVPRGVKAGGGLVSTVSSPHAGRLEEPALT